MTTYEALLIFKPFIDGENTDNSTKTIEKSLKAVDGKVIKMDKIGRKRLGYEINNFKDGFFLNCLFEVATDKIEAFRRSFDHNEDLLRITLIKLKSDEVESLQAAALAREKALSAPPSDIRRRPDHHGRPDHHFREAR